MLDNWRKLYKLNQIRVYLFDQKNKSVINKKFDKLHAQNRIKWNVTTTFFSFLYFIIWKIILKDRKGYVVIDIQILNKITMLNVYFMSFQADIFIVIKNVKFIFTIDAANFFYQ